MPKSVYFKISPNKLPKSDPRFKKWLDSLKRRPPPWNKGKTRFVDARVNKISETFKRKHIDNFANWREKARQNGIIPSNYPIFNKDEYLSYLVGMILGDGSIYKFPRTEKLTITLGTDKPELISFVTKVTEKVFNKKPSVYKSGLEKVHRIVIYQKLISERLEIPLGKRRYSQSGIPEWVWKDDKSLIYCLKGLYEAEASLCIHLPTSTYNFSFHNKNEKLLSDVSIALKKFNLNPEIRSYAIRLRRRNEVKYFSKLINFRKYFLRDHLMVG